MYKLFLDIETIPADEESREVLRHVYEKRKKRKKERGQEETVSFETFWRGTSLDGTFGRVFCIAYAIDNDPVEIIYEKDDEKEMLVRFWEIARSARLFVGHNVLEFDLKFIYQRSIVRAIKPSKEISFARYRSDPVYDTMREWGKWSSGSVGLEALAMVLGIPSPKEGGIDGTLVFDFYKKGRVDEILEYCKRDVETTRKVYKRMTFN